MSLFEHLKPQVACVESRHGSTMWGGQRGVMYEIAHRDFHRSPCVRNIKKLQDVYLLKSFTGLKRPVKG